MPLLWIDRVLRTKELPTVNTGKTPPTDPLTRRERRAMLIAAVVFVAGIAVGVAAWKLTGHCSMGGAVEHACGAEARDWCRAVSVQHDAHSEAVLAQCRIARIPP